MCLLVGQLPPLLVVLLPLWLVVQLPPPVVAELVPVLPRFSQGKFIPALLLGFITTDIA